MDFALDKTQKDIQKAARDFAKGEFDKELALELEEKGYDWVRGGAEGSSLAGKER